jgi:hypothetical protein
MRTRLSECHQFRRCNLTAVVLFKLCLRDLADLVVDAAIV